MAESRTTVGPAESPELAHAPAVSIGMPVYNGAEYIREALDSLLAQTFTNYELIISDNASTDRTEAICREYAAHDPRIRYVRQKENCGPLGNFQFVMDEAEGEYFMWASADDMLGTIETLANLVKSLDKGFELAIPDVDLIDETTGINRLGVHSSVYSGLKRDSVTRLALKFPSYMTYGLFRTTSLRSLFIFLKANSDLICFGEGIFVHAISEKLKCVFVHDASLIYRRHSTNSSSTVKAPALLRSFLKYTFRVFKYYLKSSYSILDKVHYLGKLSFIHARYILVLVAAAGKYYGYKLFIKRGSSW